MDHEAEAWAGAATGDDEGELGPAAWTVRGRALPGPLVDLLAAGGWRHPGDEVMREVVPWIEEPLHFPADVAEMRRESRSLDFFADDERSSALFREVRGSVVGSVDLPWLDVEQAVLIVVNRRPGEDVAIALDYREDAEDPRVVGSDFRADRHVCAWRIVAPTLTDFAQRLGLPVGGSAGRPPGATGWTGAAGGAGG
ncbi:hypothetical protein OG948_49280 (plasmid) [Embleya sp. NBC_00888]|uniref:hypothetical protein n=1 Tax=Embleya sp. NBC_00888 TaxID=2975960 RepID=UPI002F90DCF2|nr:hypothetical protein OG948_49280 [Embleya sp. NBC_00888]